MTLSIEVIIILAMFFFIVGVLVGVSINRPTIR